MLGGRALLVVCQTNGTIVGLHSDSATGALPGVGSLAAVTALQFVGALRLP